MLTQEEVQLIREATAAFERKRGASIEALRIVQRRVGWVSDQDLHDIAQLLEMTPAELDGVATFYNLIYRQPVGRHVILICDSVTCWILGYEDILERLKSLLGIELGGTTTDNRFTLLPVACLGVCDHAPALMIDEDVHVDLMPDGLEEILAQYP
jgi:NADH-quinone oxidoreductase subunit E